MSSEQYLLKNEFMAIIYNPSVLQQEHAMISMQQPQVKKDIPVSNMNVLYWDKEGKAFVDALSENYCYKKPHRVTNEKDEIIMHDCELYVHRPIAPLSYEIVKIQFTKMESVKPKEEIKAKETIKDASLNFTGETKKENLSLDYTKLC